MRLIHTSDWHLGHRLHGRRRDEEHRVFLDWLLEQVATLSADVVLIAGDVFDTANPPASALQLWYGFLAAARARFPGLDVVVIGGNHDSAARIDAPRPVLRDHGVHIVGGVPRDAAGGIKYRQMVYPLTDGAGTVAAWVAAVPFLRPVDLPRVPVGADEDVLIEGVRKIYDEILDVARGELTEGQALITTGHCFMVDGQTSDESERKVLGGNLHALPATVFGSDVAYVALGHLHRPQLVGNLEHVRYCGSPFPLSMKEATYKHQVLVVDFDGAALAKVESVRTPRAVPVLRIPTRGTGSPEDVMARLAELPELAPSMPHWQRPFLEVAIATDAIDPSLRARIDDLMMQKAAQLVRLHIGGTDTDDVEGQQLPLKALSELHEEEVFCRAWRARFGDAPPPTQIAMFHELIDLVRQPVEDA